MVEKLDYMFSIKRVKKTNDIDYINALKIYNEKIPYEIKTTSNEITMWLNEDDKKSPFNLYCFILYFNNEVIGFSMETYIKRSKIIVGEYMSLKNEFNFETVIFTYIDLMHNYYKTNNLDIAYFVNEISNKNSGNSIDKESKLFKKMLCVQGYGEIDAPYTTLPLGLDNFESSFDAKIYIKSNDEMSELSKDTYLKIVESIYYDYFIVWYKIMFTDSEIEKYKQKVDMIFESIHNELVKENKIKIKYTDCPVLKENRLAYQTINLNSKSKNKVLGWLIILLIVLIFPPLITFLYTGILNLLKINLNDISSLLGESIGGILTFISTYIVYKKVL